LFKVLAVVNQIADQAENECDMIIIVQLIWPQRPQQRSQTTAAAADSDTENTKSFMKFKPKVDLRDVRLLHYDTILIYRIKYIEKNTDNWKYQSNHFLFWFSSFWVIPRRLCVTGRRFRTLYRFHLHRQVDEDGTDREFRNVGQ
jgi:hypothetical protein